MGVKKCTVAAWEVNRHPVAVSLIPRVLAFLGYDPRDAGTSLGERIRAKRESLGLSAVAFAVKLGVSRSTIQAWEGDRLKRPIEDTRERFKEFLEDEA